MEIKPASVSFGTKQAGECEIRKYGAEPCVWTDRMLAALNKGVKGGTWFSLIDKVSFMINLQVSYEKVRKNRGAPGVDHITIELFGKQLDSNLQKLHKQLEDGTYQPQMIRRKLIPKSGKKNEYRPLGIPTVRDRVVQTALRNVIEPIFEKDFAEHSYGFRPKRGCKDALRRVDVLLKQGYHYVVDADLKSYFDTISHDKLLDLVKEKISDGKVLTLIEKFLKQKVIQEMKEWTPEEGSPQGAVISPLLSNIYLNPLDHLMVKKGIEMVRYADDLVLLCRSQEEANNALQILRDWTETMALTLHPTKTCIVNAVTEGFNFLGYRFVNNIRIVGDKSIRKLKDTIRSKTKRSRGDSLSAIIQDVNKTLRGWFEYFKHSRPCSFTPLDGWIRMRLRSVLRKQLKMKHGAWAGENHIRWPNAFFADHGLYCLVEARKSACQPCNR